MAMGLMLYGISPLGALVGWERYNHEIGAHVSGKWRQEELERSRAYRGGEGHNNYEKGRGGLGEGGVFVRRLSKKGH